MTQRQTLTTLRDLLAEEETRAAQRFGAANQALTEAKTKAQTLMQFRDEYHEKYRQALERGDPFALLQNLQQFLARLDQAIHLQAEAVAHATQEVDEARAAWQAAMGKRKAFDLLLARQEAAQKAQEEKAAQKLLDEWASQRALRVPNEGGPEQ
ncbi:flagellar export protein FliJ [Hydrogenophilus thiooxidans]|uniref:flagellar export protein FliJ n=1 Tax=Hydrogenophilus thiooxidans TaxID=2820326 RepID=UPI001C24F174|nr:flagellar export protein FliJ [Hydrogenophilus thiooxidans]